MLKKLRISTKIFSGFGIMIALLLVISVVGVTGMLLTKSPIQKFMRHSNMLRVSGS